MRRSPSSPSLSVLAAAALMVLITAAAVLTVPQSVGAATLDTTEDAVLDTTATRYVRPGAKRRPAPPQEGTPMHERVRFGVHTEGVPSDMSGLADLERRISRTADVVHFFQAWGSEWRDLDATWLANASAGGRDILLTWEPWDFRGGVDQPDFALARIAAGDHDDYIRTWAEGLAAHDGTVNLRLMHEMNGDWYPWSGVTNGNSPADYVAAWRHVHDLFDEAGATNVRFVWCPMADDVPASNTFEAYWPGAGYVDVLALDGYNWGADMPSHGGWRSAEEIFAGAYDRLVALADKPVWLAEVGSADAGGDKAGWIRDLLTSTRYPAVDTLVWFDLDKEQDWRLASSPATRRVARQLLGR